MKNTIITSPLQLITNDPLDIRLCAVDNMDDLYVIPMNERYIGMTKLVASEQQEYWLLNNISNSAWVKKNNNNNILIQGNDKEIIMPDI